MKQSFTVALIILTISSFAFGQMKSKQSESDRKTILQIESELSEALTNNDHLIFEKHLSDSFIFSPPFGDILNKPEWLEIVKYDSLRVEHSKIADFKLQINGQTAIAAYRSSDNGFFKFVDISGQYEWIDVFEKRKGYWQLIYKRGTAIH